MKNRKPYYRRPGKPSQRGRRGGGEKGLYDNPRIDPQLKQTFKSIGIPEKKKFTPDSFQLEALEKVKTSDVLVSAPTGSGKTWIAEQAIAEYLSKGMVTWYASPLKALSNSIYLEFCREFGLENCGILTGDRKENPGAPIIVGTTEILRNQLYDAMQEGTDIEADLVILDEAHYLSDPERGVVWEEVLIYLPSRVRLLLLSATISNAKEICAWLGDNRKKKSVVVLSDERPVPLETLFLFPDGLISPLGSRKGLAPRVKKFLLKSGRKGIRRGAGKIKYGEIVKCLDALDLLPAIFFLKSRSDCDSALLSCGTFKKTVEEKGRIRKEVRSFLRKYPHLEGHRQISPLLFAGVGSHHAGQLPYWKVLVEKTMNKGYLDAIFSTSTVAAGVNFPARTVVLVQSDRYNGHEFKDLTATELHQMTGRAGRRGMDNIGFAIVIPGLYQDPDLICELKDSSPEPVMSRININFSMTLNLLLSHRPEEIKDLFNRSFAAFQERTAGTNVRKKWYDLVDDMGKMLPDARCDIDDPHEIIENIQIRAELKREVSKLSRDLRSRKMKGVYRKLITPGRLFLHRNKGIYVITGAVTSHGGLACEAYNIKKALQFSNHRLKKKKVATQQIKKFFNYMTELPEDDHPDSLIKVFEKVPIGELETLHVDIDSQKDGFDELRRLDETLQKLPCENCGNQKLCHGSRDNKDFKIILRDIRSLSVQIQGMTEGLWVSFKKHIRFLKDTGFVTKDDRLTPDGIWASKLRLDHPLLIAEAIRKGVFEGITPEALAGCIAPFVWDRFQEVEFKVQGPISLKECEKAFKRVLRSIDGIRNLKANRGFENPQILLWPAAALFLWAKNIPWEQLILFFPVEEGDIASLIVRTADHLRQVINLRETYPELAANAKMALELILREPVYLG